MISKINSRVKFIWSSDDEREIFENFEIFAKSQFSSCDKNVPKYGPVYARLHRHHNHQLGNGSWLVDWKISNYCFDHVILEFFHQKKCRFFQLDVIICKQRVNHLLCENCKILSKRKVWKKFAKFLKKDIGRHSWFEIIPDNGQTYTKQTLSPD